MNFIFIVFVTCICAINPVKPSKILLSTILPSNQRLLMDLADLLRKHHHVVEFVLFQNEVTEFTRRNFAVNVVKPELNFTLNEFEFVTNPYDQLTDLSRWCWHLFNDSKLSERVGGSNYDVIVLDLSANDVCGLAWAKKLGLSVIGVLPKGLTIPIAHYLDIPWFSHLDDSELDMVERIGNIIDSYFVIRKWNNLYYYPTEKIIAEFIKGDVNTFQLYEGINLLLTNENSLLETLNPALTNFVPIGGFHCDSPNPIPKNVDEYIKSFRQGIVFVWLPPVDHIIPENKKMLENIFQHFPLYAFVWERKDKATDNVQNLLIIETINKQDILGHPRTRLFISFCDSANVYSAIFHGVPIMCIPTISNINNKMMSIVAKRKIGVTLENLSEDSVVQGMRKLLMDRSFYGNSRKLSTNFRDQSDTPGDRFIFWVEYAIRYNGRHEMKKFYVKSSVQYYALDVAVIYLVFSTIFVIVVGVILYLAIKIWRLPKSKGKVE